MMRVKINNFNFNEAGREDTHIPTKCEAVEINLLDCLLATIKWGLEYQTSLVFGWSIAVRFRSQPYKIRKFKMAALA